MTHEEQRGTILEVWERHGRWCWRVSAPQGGQWRTRMGFEFRENKALAAARNARRGMGR